MKKKNFIQLIKKIENVLKIWRIQTQQFKAKSQLLIF